MPPTSNPRKTGRTDPSAALPSLTRLIASLPSNTRYLALMLGLILLGLAIASDLLCHAPQLTPPLLAAALVSALLSRWGMPQLRQLKLGQVIREDGPQAHFSKAGTPTLGGLLVVPVGVIIGSMVAPSDPRLPAVAAITLAYMTIGAIDDWRSLTKHHNTGLTPRGKLLLQAVSAAAFLYWAAQGQHMGSNISLPLGWVLPLGLLIWPLGLFVFLAESNATNLTDGLDGLAAGCGAIVFSGLGVQLMLRGHEGDPALAGFCAAMAGCWLGFLVYNRYPAKVFMGDTGSLAMGAALAAVALLSNSLWPLLLMGGVFLAESLSVIIQVWVFKATKGLDGVGRRVLLMAPLHHHFELKGVQEGAIVHGFILINLFLVAACMCLIP